MCWPGQWWGVASVAGTPTSLRLDPGCTLLESHSCLRAAGKGWGRKGLSVWSTVLGDSFSALTGAFHEKLSTE